MAREKEYEGKLYRRTFMWKGQRVYASGRTPEEAAANRALKKRALEKGEKLIEKQGTLCKDWADIYFEKYREPVIVAKSYRDEKSLWKVHIRPVIGAKILSGIKPLDCQDVLNKMSAKGRREKQIRKAMIFTNAMFRAAIENNLLVENPAANLKMPDCAENNSHRPITDEERTALLAACDALPYPHGLFACLMLYCGLRPDETSRVKWDDFDLIAPRLYVDGTKGKKTKKKKSRRWVPIPAALLPRLYAPLAVYDEKLRKDVKPLMNEAYALINKDGKPITETQRGDLWKRIIKEMNVLMGGERYEGVLRDIREWDGCIVAKDFVAYDLRHTYACDLRDAGVPIDVAAEYLGHVDLTMLKRVYLHATHRSFSDSLEKINAFQGSSVGV